MSFLKRMIKPFSYKWKRNKVITPRFTLQKSLLINSEEYKAREAKLKEMKESKFIRG